MKRPAGDRGGFALIGALWLLVMISAVGLDFALRTRALTLRAINASDHAAARAAAEGCLAQAAAILEEPLSRTSASEWSAEAGLDPWREPSRLGGDTVEIGAARCVYRLEDAGARLHLNRTSEDELRRLMVALRVDASDADEVAQAILDWRDMDGLRRARGGEAADYVEEGRAVLPSNGPFGDVEELERVRGMTPASYRKLAPMLTVTGSGRVNLGAAPPEVISSLPGMSGDLLALILRARRSGAPVGDLLSLTADLDPEARDRLRADLPALLGRVVGETQEVLVEVEAWLPGAASRVGARAVAVRAGGSVFLVERMTGAALPLTVPK